MYTLSDFPFTIELDVEVTYSHTPELSATHMEPAEGGVEIEAVYIKGRDGKRVDITHLISEADLDEMAACAHEEVKAAQGGEYDNEE